MHAEKPSAWVRRFAPLIRSGGRVLDLAAGGRPPHAAAARYGAERDSRSTAMSKNCAALAGPACDIRAIDLETGDPDSVVAHLGGIYDGIVVTNYLHRPLLRPLAAALAPGGVLIYETFMIGNERFGRPRNPDFLLRPGELLDAFAALTIVAFEQGEVTRPRPAMIQRIAAVAGPVGPLPEGSASGA